MKVVYIAYPFRAPTDKEIQKNIDTAIEYGKAALGVNLIPIVPHINTAPLFGIHNDSKEDNQRVAYYDLELLARCDELWACGETISKGMQYEIDFCKAKDIPVRYVKIEKK